MAFATAVLPGTFGVLLPAWLASADPGAAADEPLLVVSGGVLMACGAGIVAVCTSGFATRGRGTPAPWDPPRMLVTEGIYARSRNPMYVGVLAFVGGLAVVFASGAVATYGAVLALAFHAREVLWEEPRLRRQFGNRYVRYCTRVPRWFSLRTTRAAKDLPATSASGRAALSRPRP